MKPEDQAAFEAAFIRTFVHPENADQLTFRLGWQACCAHRDAQPAVAVNEQLIKALADTARIIGGQLDLIEQRAKGDFLNKRPVVQSLTAHRTRIQKAIAAAAAEAQIKEQPK